MKTAELGKFQSGSGMPPHPLLIRRFMLLGRAQARKSYLESRYSCKGETPSDLDFVRSFPNDGSDEYRNYGWFGNIEFIYRPGPRDRAFMERRDSQYLRELVESPYRSDHDLFLREMESLGSSPHHRRLWREFENALLTDAEKFFQDVSKGSVDKVAATMRKRPEPDWLATALNDVFDLSIAKDASGRRPGKEKTGVTPLYKAVEIGNFLMVSHLLSHARTNPNKVCRSAKESGLHLAVKKGLRDIAGALLGHASTDVNLKDNQGNTPLHVAVCNNNKSLVELLLSHDRMDKNIKDGSGKTALYLAVEKGRIDIVKVLLAHEVEPNILCQNETALHLAVRKGNVEAVRALLSHSGIDVNIFDANVKTPLYVAVEKGRIDIVKVLLAHEVEPNILCQNETALHLAVRKGNVEAVRALLSHSGINVNIFDANDKTPLYVAVDNGRSEIVRSLLSQDGCDPNRTCLTTEEDKEAVLHLAVRKGNTEILKQLLDRRDIDVNQINNKTGEQGKTALYLSVEAKNKEFVELLLQKGADKKITCNKEIIKNDLPSKKRPLDLANELVDADKSQEALAELLKEEMIPSDAKNKCLDTIKLGAIMGVLKKLMPMMMKDYNLAKCVDLVKSSSSAIKDKALDPLKREYKKASCKDFISELDSKLVELYKVVKNKLKKYDEKGPDLNLSGKFQEILDEMSVSGTLTLTA